MFHSSGSSFESDSVKPSIAKYNQVQVGESAQQRKVRNYSHHAC